MPIISIYWWLILLLGLQIAAAWRFRWTGLLAATACAVALIEVGGDLYWRHIEAGFPSETARSAGQTYFALYAQGMPLLATVAAFILAAFALVAQRTSSAPRRTL